MSPLADAELTDLLYAQVARVGHALSSPHRLVLLDLLSQGEKTVETLAERANYPVKNTSAHLRALREARLVLTRRAGKFVHYRVADPDVPRFLHDLRELARGRLTDVDRLLRDHAGREVPTVAVATLGDQIGAARRPVVLDLRPADEHASARVPGARSVPSAVLPGAVDTLPLRAHFVVYCRGAYCTHAADAVTLLAASGRTAHALAGGFVAWQREGRLVDEDGRVSPAGARPSARTDR